MPCNPSAPPVSQAIRFASSYRMEATPNVTMSRVRSEPRSTSGLLAAPSTVAAAQASSNPSTGSSMPCTVAMPAT